MNDIQKTFAQRHEEVSAMLGDNTPERFLAEIALLDALIDEFRDLQDWFTDEYDNAVMDGVAKYTNSTALGAYARQVVKETDPEKFERFRELENKLMARDARHQAVASAAHASIVESNLRIKTWQ